MTLSNVIRTTDISRLKLIRFMIYVIVQDIFSKKCKTRKGVKKPIRSRDFQDLKRFFLISIKCGTIVYKM